jgi:hypothetical protein
MGPKIAATALLLVGSAVTANAQPVNLSCAGTFKEFEPERLDASVPPTASSVDLQERILKVPLGPFSITSVNESSLTIESNLTAPTLGPLIVTGWLDRTTGNFTAFWYRPEEKRKMDAGQTAHASMYLELGCSVSKRLF